METDLADIIDIGNVFTNVDPAYPDLVVTEEEPPVFETLEDAQTAYGTLTPVGPDADEEEEGYAPV